MKHEEIDEMVEEFDGAVDVLTDMNGRMVSCLRRMVANEEKKTLWFKPELLANVQRALYELSILQEKLGPVSSVMVNSTLVVIGNALREVQAALQGEGGT